MCYFSAIPHLFLMCSCLVHDIILFGSELNIVCLSCKKLTHTKVNICMYCTFLCVKLCIILYFGVDTYALYVGCVI